MNGRLYDPVVGRFLSVDNYVQNPDFSQNFNRYSYCLNNPLRYNDPDGEKIIDIWIWGFAKGLFNSIRGRHEEGHQTILGDAFASANRYAVNSVKILGGLFAADTDRKGWGWQIVSRFTWELPQTIVGYASSNGTNWLGHVNEVDYWGGATVLQTQGQWGAITLGSYIIGDRNIIANPNNSLFQHEYGHYLQSQSSGWFYFSKYGIPSLLSKDPHNQHPVEQDANIRAFTFFNERIEGYSGWIHDERRGGNPINGYHWNLPYNDPSNQTALRSGRLTLSWYDYLMSSSNLMVGSMVVPGLINTFFENVIFNMNNSFSNH